MLIEPFLQQMFWNFILQKLSRTDDKPTNVAGQTVFYDKLLWPRKLFNGRGEKMGLESEKWG